MNISRKNKIRRIPSQRIIFAIAFAFLIIYSAFILYHFYFLMQLATKGSSPEFTASLLDNTLATWSDNFTLSNFTMAFSKFTIEKQSFFMLVFNSLWYSIGSMVISLFFECCATYVVCKYKFKGSALIYNVVILRLMLPIVGALPSAYRIYKMCGFVNSPLILVTACDALGGNFLILYAFFKGISWEYAEAAFIDGANHFDVFFRIMLRMAMPAISVLFITGFIGCWNEYMSISVFMPKLPTLSYSLYVYEQNMKYLGNQPVYFAGVFLAALPCIAMFLIFQNSIMQTVHLGGLKG